jgi:hypothetical protein
MENLLYWAAGIVTVGGALALLWRLLTAGVKTGKRWDMFLEDFHGTPARPGRPAVPGIMERLVDQARRMEALEVNMAAVRHEMFPNSGGSLRDAVDRLEADFRQARDAVVPSQRRGEEMPVGGRP